MRAFVQPHRSYLCVYSRLELVMCRKSIYCFIVVRSCIDNLLNAIRFLIYYPVSIVFAITTIYCFNLLSPPPPQPPPLPLPSTEPDAVLLCYQ